jgi:nucleoside-diphosphate-sugar epimerase
MEAERHVREASSHKAIATTILRPTWIYGPRDSYIMPKIIDALRQGRYKWIGDGTNRLSLVHVADVAGAVVMALEHPAAAGQTYNVADDESSPTQREFIGSICRSLDISMPVSSISYQTARRIGFLGECVAHATGFRVCPPITRLSVLLLGGHRKFSNKKIKSDLGWQPSMTFDDGIGETLRWHNNNQRPS